MRLLLDTHVVIWCLEDSPLLRGAARDTVISPANAAFVSAASIWEIAIKLSTGKLKLRGGTADRIVDDITEFGFAMLAVTAHHAVGVRSLPWHHSDPFDRLLIAQARHEGLTLMTTDDRIAKYDVATINAR